MNKKNITKIIFIISVVILILGILISIGISNELLEVASSSKNVYVDGTDFTGAVEVVGTIGAKFFGMLAMFFTILIDVSIWIAYGIISLIISIVKKIQSKKSN